MLFNLGRLLMTSGVATIMEDSETRTEISKCIKRHMTGDFGELCDFDKNENSLVLENGFIHGRIFSKYNLDSGDAIYIITEKVNVGNQTTILFPSEY